MLISALLSIIAQLECKMKISALKHLFCEIEFEQCVVLQRYLFFNLVLSFCHIAGCAKIRNGLEQLLLISQYL
ncbi:hypothetical protein DZ985_05535 [Acinetobacter sp. JW]|nr:hypothetical protein DZ985_05535 [Acinetobacter sp. JW]